MKLGKNMIALIDALNDGVTDRKELKKITTYTQISYLEKMIEKVSSYLLPKELRNDVIGMNINIRNDLNLNILNEAALFDSKNSSIFADSAKKHLKAIYSNDFISIVLKNNMKYKVFHIKQTELSRKRALNNMSAWLIGLAV